MFDIFVDADSVPLELRSIIIRTAVNLDCNLFFVADRSLPDVISFINTDTFRRRCETGGGKEVKSKVRMCVVDSGENSADDRIVSMVQSSSLCITHDIPLAARLLEKGCIVIDDRGTEYTAQNINSMLVGREIHYAMRNSGVFIVEKSRNSERRKKDFANCLNRTITKMLKTIQKDCLSG